MNANQNEILTNNIEYAVLLNGCIIIQSGASSSFLGRLDLTVEGGHITDIKHQLIPLFAEEYEDDQEVAHIADEILSPYRQKLDLVVGKQAIYRKNHYAVFSYF